MTLDNTLIKKFENSFTENVSLSNYSWFNLGGKAEYFYKAKDISELKKFFKRSERQKIKNNNNRCRL